jgi:GTP-dependent dephospho-CoA kinase
LQEFTFTEELRNAVKSPLGKLLKDSEITKEMLNEYFLLPNLTVCVGDRTTEKINDLGFSPNLEIVDKLERRYSRPPPRSTSPDQYVLNASNKQGTISIDALQKLSVCLDSIVRNRQKKVRLVIDGEEDLLALPVIAFFPEDTVVFYGQPGEGLVIVNSDSNQNARRILAILGIRSLGVP